jgi:hypothetical protein
MLSSLVDFNDDAARESIVSDSCKLEKSSPQDAYDRISIRCLNALGFERFSKANHAMDLSRDTDQKRRTGGHVWQRTNCLNREEQRCVVYGQGVFTTNSMHFFPFRSWLKSKLPSNCLIYGNVTSSSIKQYIPAYLIFCSHCPCGTTICGCYAPQSRD